MWQAMMALQSDSRQGSSTAECTLPCAIFFQKILNSCFSSSWPMPDRLEKNASKFIKGEAEAEPQEYAP